MSDELGRRLEELAAGGEHAGLPVAPDAVRGRARHRQQRRRVLSGGALAAIVIGVVAALASGSGSPSGQHIKVVGGSTTVVVPTTALGLPTPTTFAPNAPVILPPDGPAVSDVSRLSGLDFADPELGYALVGDPARLARTQDGGATWHVVGPSQPFGAVSVSRLTVSGRDLYAWGPGLSVSHDGGATWVASTLPAVYDVKASGTGAWALTGCPDPTCGEEIQQSVDGGRTWGLAVGFSFHGSSGSLAVAQEEHVYVSSPGFGAGAQAQLGWGAPHMFTFLPDPCQTGDVVFQQAAAVAATDLWLACAGSPATIQQGKQVYRSADGGQHWNLVASVGYGTDKGSITLSGHVNRLVAVDDTRAWLALDRIGILATADGGRTWHEAFSVQPDSGPVEITIWPGTTDAWAVAGQTIWRTTDGVNWTKL